jgi:oligopeptidase B
VIAQVLFVDVATTMLDETIPLTTGEYEMGKSNVKRYYKYMKSYSPYDNVKPQAYPNMYISTGLHDHKYSIGSQLNGLLSYEL